MKLSECKHGTIVITHDNKIGMIIGLTYNVDKELAKQMSPLELIDRTIPLVQFPDVIHGVHHCNLTLYTK